MADAIIIEESIRLTGKQVTAIIKGNDPSQFIRNVAYYKGKNPPVIADGLEKAEKNINPNNVVPLPFARRTINDLMGYAFKPGNVNYVYTDEETNSKSVDKIKEIFEDNDADLESSEVFLDTSVKGEGAELLYFADERIQFDKIDRETCIFKYADTIKEDTLKWSIRYYHIADIDPAGDEIKIYKAEVYTPTTIDYYEYTQKGAEGRPLTDKDYVYIDSQPHPFNAVPLYPYRINSDKMGVYQASIPIIDKLDSFGSDSIANAIDQFNDTILTLSLKLDAESAEKIKELKVIDGLGGKEEGNFAEFLQRNLDITNTLESTKLFERWYYELNSIPNLNDEKFGTPSGIAIAYALVPFENLVTTMETYFSKGLQHRLELINNALLFLDSSYTVVEATLEWQRNLPFDLETRSKIAVALKGSGLLSDETLLKLFPSSLVEDIPLEIEKRDKEKEANMAAFMATETKFNTDDSDDADDN